MSARQRRVMTEDEPQCSQADHKILCEYNDNPECSQETAAFGAMDERAVSVRHGQRLLDGSDGEAVAGGG